MADVAAELSHPGAAELLGSAGLARLAYAGPDGYPRVIPIGYFWDGERVVMCTAPTAPKVAALQERPHVALTIDGGATPAEARSLLLRGVADIDIVDGVAPEYLAAAAKTREGEDLAQFEASVRATFRQQARIAVRPRWARYFDFGQGPMPKFLVELAGEQSS